MHIGKWQITKKDLVWFIICLVIVVCGLIGLLHEDDTCASTVLSGASTAISIVLSIVAILYTMIEGANTSQLNQETITKLNQIDIQLREVSQKTIEMKELKVTLDKVVPQIDAVIKNIEETSDEGTTGMFDEETKKSIERLRRYIREDIDE